MAEQSDAELRTMLTLAAITYRGFNLVWPEPFKRVRLRQLMDQCMAKFSAVKDQWKIVWGPASRSAAPVGLDDAVMYVAQSIASPSTIAIAIRGTNPISPNDWLSGDLNVAGQVHWVYGKAPEGALISKSTDFGLRVLQHLRWSKQPSSSTAILVLKSISSSLLGWLRAKGKANGDNGTSLKDFLRAHIASNAKADIYVTGHSKGGVLSSTMALWLADTQGAQKVGDDEWDVDRKATIRCYSFAGPTAGNDVFARYSDGVLRENCHRIWNKLDVVPRAFVADKLREIPTLYELDIDKEAVKLLVDGVADTVQPLNYTQIAGEPPLDCELIAGLPFPVQAIHQHLDSYLDKFGLIGEMSAETLLAPVL